MALQAFRPQTGDSYNCKDNTDKPLIVRIKETKDRVKTRFTAEATKWDSNLKKRVPDEDVRENGGPAIILDIVEIEAGKPRIYRDVLWMTETVVDRLWSQTQGASLPLKIVKAPGKNYLVPEALTEKEMGLAEQFEARHGEDFFDKGLKAVSTARKAAVPAQAEAPVAETFTGDLDEDDE